MPKRMKNRLHTSSRLQSLAIFRRFQKTHGSLPTTKYLSGSLCSRMKAMQDIWIIIPQRWITISGWVMVLAIKPLKSDRKNSRKRSCYHGKIMEQTWCFLGWRKRRRTQGTLRDGGSSHANRQRIRINQQSNTETSSISKSVAHMMPRRQSTARCSQSGFGVLYRYVDASDRSCMIYIISDFMCAMLIINSS